MNVFPDELTPPERELLARVTQDQACRFPHDLPAAERTIRAFVIQALMRKAVEGVGAYAGGVRLHNAIVGNDLVLDGITTDCSIELTRCEVEGALSAYDFHGRSMVLDGSTLHHGLRAQLMRLSGRCTMRVHREEDEAIRRGAVAFRRTTAYRAVTLHGAEIGGNLDLTGALLKPEKTERRALAADRLRLGGSLFMASETGGDRRPFDTAQRFEAYGAVRFVAAHIDGNVYCNGGYFNRGARRALRLTAARIGGSVQLCAHITQHNDTVHEPHFECRGGVDLNLARIQGELLLDDGEFTCPTRLDTSDRSVIEDGLRMRGTVVEGRLSVRAGTSFDTGADLRGCRIGVYYQARHQTGRTIPSPEIGYRFLPSKVRLAGIQIGRIDVAQQVVEQERITAAEILRKLLDRADRFEPEAYISFAGLLRASGNTADATALYIEMRRRQRVARLRFVRQSTLREPFRVAGALLVYGADWVIDRFAGYGLNPSPLAVVSLLMLVWGAVVFDAADGKGAMIPDSLAVLTSQSWLECSEHYAADPRQQVDCWRGNVLPGEPPEAAGAGADYLAFDPTIYAVDVFVPFISLRQAAQWRPSSRRGGVYAVVLSALLTVAGWIFSAGLVAVIANFLRRP